VSEAGAKVVQPGIGTFASMTVAGLEGPRYQNARVFISAPYEVERPRCSRDAHLRSGERDDGGNRLAGDDGAPQEMTSKGNWDGDERRNADHRTAAERKRATR